MPAPQTDNLLLTCKDFRITRHIARYMAGRGLDGDYDHIVLAGASLGAMTERYPSWSQTFWDHLDLAIALHQVKRLLVLDHRDCGAYRLILGEDLAPDPARETAVHAATMRALREAVKARHPDLETELLLMALDGSVETVD